MCIEYTFGYVCINKQAKLLLVKSAAIKLRTNLHKIVLNINECSNKHLLNMYSALRYKLLTQESAHCTTSRE
jgi:hypothetical protein